MAATGAGQWRCAGSTAARYRVRDYFNDRELGEVSSAQNVLQLAFERFMVLEAIPV